MSRTKKYEFRVWFERRGSIIVTGRTEAEARRKAEQQIARDGIAALTTLDPQDHSEIEVLNGAEDVSG